MMVRASISERGEAPLASGLPKLCIHMEAGHPIGIGDRVRLCCHYLLGTPFDHSAQSAMTAFANVEPTR